MRVEEMDLRVRDGPADRRQGAALSPGGITPEVATTVHSVGP